jgi:hypothetical protein
MMNSVSPNLSETIAANFATQQYARENDICSIYPNSAECFQLRQGRQKAITQNLGGQGIVEFPNRPM